MTNCYVCKKALNLLALKFNSSDLEITKTNEPIMNKTRKEEDSVTIHPFLLL